MEQYARKDWDTHLSADYAELMANIAKATAEAEVYARGTWSTHLSGDDAELLAEIAKAEAELGHVGQAPRHQEDRR